MLKLHTEQDYRVRSNLVGPLYHQIYELIRERIVSGEWAGAKTIPNESELSRVYQVSVGTIRKSLDMLCQERLIVRKQGLGTFVTSLSLDRAHRFSRWMEDGIQKTEVAIRVLRATVDLCDHTASELLGVKSNTQVFRLEILNSIGATGLSINDYTIPVRFIDTVPVSSSGAPLDCAAIISEIKSRTVRCVDLISVSTLSSTQSGVLELSCETPVLKVDRTGYDADQSPLFICTRSIKLNGVHYSVVVQ